MKTFTGTVVSTKMNKTVVIERTNIRQHPLYKKTIRSRRRFKAHSEIAVVMGDVVKVVSCRPLSKDVYFQVTEKVSTALHV